MHRRYQVIWWRIEAANLGIGGLGGPGLGWPLPIPPRPDIFFSKIKIINNYNPTEF